MIWRTTSALAVLGGLLTVALSSCQDASTLSVSSSSSTPLGSGIDECGPTPQTITYDRKFTVAQARLRKEAASRALSGSATIPIEDIAIDLSGSGSNTVSKEEMEHMTVADALHIVQSTITDHRQAIIAECGFRMCTMSSGSDVASLLRLQSLGEVCSAAILGSPFQEDGIAGVGSPFTFVPSSRMVVFKDGEQTTRRSLILRHLDAGSITVKAPLSADPGGGDTSYAKYTGYIGWPWNWLLGKPESITLSGLGEEKTVTFELTKPSDNDHAKQTSPLIFKAEDANEKTATASFVLIPSADYFTPPPSIGCPQLNPRATAWAYKPFMGPETTNASDNSFHALNEKNIGAYTTNNSPIGSMVVSGECSDLTSPDSRNRTIGHYETTFDLTSGLQPSHWQDLNQSAGGYAEPTWRVSIQLPGSAARYSYTLKATFRSAMRTQCSMTIDASTATTIPVAQSNASNFTLEPGGHILAIDCPRFGGGTPWDQTQRNSLVFDLDVSRSLRMNTRTAAR
jgi:hypothetical protein